MSRPDDTAADTAMLDRAARKRPRPGPRQVLLFSGHRMDAPGRTEPRFPPAKEQAAAMRIATALTALAAGAEDLALCQAAAGGDLLFIEACQQRSVAVQILLPFEEPEFIEKSVLPSANGAHWRERYFAAKRRLRLPVRVMPREIGPLPDGVDAFERCNLWLLESALAHGVAKVSFIALWNGGGGDGPGGTAHMVAEVRRRAGRVIWIDTRLL